jgi:hypothetical protein
MLSYPVLRHFNYNKAVYIDTDASGVALGAVLTQKNANGKNYAVEYFRRYFSAPKKNYCVTRKELLAIIDALRFWKHYVQRHPHPVVVRSDHSSLQWLCNFKEPSGQLARWMEKLEDYNFKIEHQKASATSNADGLSRRPCTQGCPHCSKSERAKKPSYQLY